MCMTEKVEESGSRAKLRLISKIGIFEEPAGMK